MLSDVYVEQPEGFEDLGKNKVEFVCKLKKCLYGLHEASKNWHIKLDRELEALGLKQCYSEPCVYYNDTYDLFVTVYVDDLAVWGARERINWFKRELSNKMTTNDLGEIEKFLSFNITRTADEVRIDQHIYAKAVLEKFNMDNAKGVSTPLASKFDDRDTTKPFSENMYRKAIGSLLYLTTGTRMDMSFAVLNQS